MTTLQIVLIVILALIILSINLFYHLKVSYVKDHSLCLHNIKKHNNAQRLVHFDFEQLYYWECNTKTQWDCFNFDSRLASLIEQEPDIFIGLVDAVTYNRQSYPEYEKQFCKIINEYYDYDKMIGDFCISPKEFRKIECEQCEEIKLRVNLDFLFHLVATYTSLHGRNSYQNPASYRCDDIQTFLVGYHQKLKHKQSKAYQRSLLTSKLRKRILDRDGHRCVICGATAKDGVKLHVDHIIPIALGGVTDESNLRTLCETCNLGKGASYNPYGKN